MVQTFGCEPGGIEGLIELIGEHRSAFAYDWRARFGLPLRSIGTTVDWCEALDLYRELMRDSSSRVCASVAGWSDPADLAALVLMDLYDLTAAANSKRRPRARPRPWDGPRRIGKGARLPQRDIRAALAARGH